MLPKSISLIILTSLVLSTAGKVFAEGSANTGKCNVISEFAICEKFNVQDGRQMIVYGLGNTNLIKSRVEKWGYRPVEIDRENSVVMLNFVDYKKTDIGAYSEFILMYPIVRKGSKFQPKSLLGFIVKAAGVKNKDSAPEVGYYLEKLILDGADKKAVDHAVVTGVQFYGMPKEKGHIDSQLGAWGQKTLKVSSESKDFGLAINLNRFSSLGLFSIPADSSIYLMSDKNGEAVWSKGSGPVSTTLPLFVLKKNSVQLQIAASSPLSGLSFSPSYWVYVNKLSFVFSLADLTQFDRISEKTGAK